MERTASYTVFIIRTAEGYQAYSPAFPDISATARGTRLAYAKLKVLIKARLLSLFAQGSTAAPKDPVIQVRALRLDLWYLKEQEELR
jgi:hypothetical protein